MPIGDIPASISEPGKLPPEPFANHHDLTSACTQMTQADAKRAEWRASYEGVWGGNPVYSLETLKTANQSWRARANYREMEGLVSSEQTLDFDLEHEVDTIIDIDLDFGTGQDQRNWEDCIEQQFTWLIRQRWDDYNFHVPFRIFQKLLHGMGAHVWPDTSGNWTPRTPRAGQILFPDECPLNFNEDGEYFMLRDFLPAKTLHAKIANEKESRGIGWNPDVVWKALAMASKSDSGTRNNLRPEEYQRRMRNGEIGNSASRQSGVWLNTVFVREFETGNISQYAVAEGIETGGYLFKKRNRFDDFSDVLTLFPYDIGDGTLHGSKGLGPRTKIFFELSNRIKNAMADQVFLGAYPHYMQTQQNLDPDKLKLMIVGAMRIAPFGLQETISKYPPLDNGPLALSRELNQTMRSNNRGSNGGNNVVEQQDRMTAEEYAMRQADNAKLNNGSVSLQRSNLRKFYQKMLFAAIKPSASNAPWAKAAKEFRDRCEKKGVPVEAFKRIAEVRAKVNQGKGSASAQLHSLMSLFQSPAYLNTSEDRKVAVERDFVAALFGYSNVDRYARNVQDDELPDSDDSMIALENESLMRGGKAVAAPRQDQVKHLTGHLAAAAEVVQAQQQGQMEPEQAYAGIHAIGEHCGQHLKFLQSNPTKKREFEELYNQWQALGAIADKLQSDIQSAAEGQSPEEKVSDGLKIGLAKVQADSQIKTAKAQGDMQLKMRKQAFTERMSAVKTGAEIQHKSIRTATDIRLATADTVASIARDHAKAKASNGASKS